MIFCWKMVGKRARGSYLQPVADPTTRCRNVRAAKCTHSVCCVFVYPSITFGSQTIILQVFEFRYLQHLVFKFGILSMLSDSARVVWAFNWADVYLRLFLSKCSSLVSIIICCGVSECCHLYECCGYDVVFQPVLQMWLVACQDSHAVSQQPVPASGHGGWLNQQQNASVSRNLTYFKIVLCQNSDFSGHLLPGFCTVIDF